MGILFFCVGLFVTSLALLTLRDHRFFQKHRITTAEDYRTVHNFAFTPWLNAFDATIITVIGFALYMVYLQISG